MLFIMPFAARRKVIVDCDTADGTICQQPVGKVTADESRAAGDEITFRSHDLEIDGLQTAGKPRRCSCRICGKNTGSGWAETLHEPVMARNPSRHSTFCDRPFHPSD